MSENIKNEGFIHSVKVPKIYKTCSKIVQTVMEEGGSLKHLLYTTVKANIKGAYALITKTIKHDVILNSVMEETKLLEENPRLNIWLAKTLIAELLIGKGSLPGESKPIQTVLSYREELQEEYEKWKVDDPSEETVEPSKPRYVRVNTLRATCDEVIKELRMEGWQLIPFQGTYPEFLDLVINLREDQFLKDFHVKDLLVFPSGTEFHHHHLYKTATIILQDKASCLPPLVLKPEPASTVLDMCAAPGMKTTMLAAMLRGKGKVYAVERSERRYKEMEKMVAAAGCENVTSIRANATRLTPESHPWCNDVQYILVDPTCTGSGMTELTQLISRPVTPGRIKQVSEFQRRLLFHALTQFPSVRRVVYSTCSIHPEENEAVVFAVLAKLPRGVWTVVPALPDWPSRGSAVFSFGKSCLTARPREDRTTGFFVAVFEKNESAESPVTVTIEPESEPEEVTLLVKKKRKQAEQNDVTDVTIEGSQKKKKKSSVDEDESILAERMKIEAGNIIIKVEKNDTSTGKPVPIKVEKDDSTTVSDTSEKKSRKKKGSEDENVLAERVKIESGNIAIKLEKNDSSVGIPISIKVEKDDTSEKRSKKKKRSVAEDESVLMEDVKPDSGNIPIKLEKNDTSVMEPVDTSEKKSRKKKKSLLDDERHENGNISIKEEEADIIIVQSVLSDTTDKRTKKKRKSVADDESVILERIKIKTENITVKVENDDPSVEEPMATEKSKRKSKKDKKAVAEDENEVAKMTVVKIEDDEISVVEPVVSENIERKSKKKKRSVHEDESEVTRIKIDSGDISVKTEEDEIIVVEPVVSETSERKSKKKKRSVAEDENVVERMKIDSGNISIKVEKDDVSIVDGVAAETSGKRSKKKRRSEDENVIVEKMNIDSKNIFIKVEKDDVSVLEKVAGETSEKRSKKKKRSTAEDERVLVKSEIVENSGIISIKEENEDISIVSDASERRSKKKSRSVAEGRKIETGNISIKVEDDDISIVDQVAKHTSERRSKKKKRAQDESVAVEEELKPCGGKISIKEEKEDGSVENETSERRSKRKKRSEDENVVVEKMEIESGDISVKEENDNTSVKESTNDRKSKKIRKSAQDRYEMVIVKHSGYVLERRADRPCCFKHAAENRRNRNNPPVVCPKIEK